jgi:PAS domain S-box-containing protein
MGRSEGEGMGQGITRERAAAAAADPAVALVVVEVDAALRRQYCRGLMSLVRGAVLERSPGLEVWALWQRHWPPLTVVSDRALATLIVAAPAVLPPAVVDRPRPVLLVVVNPRPEAGSEVLWQRLGTLDRFFTVEIVPDRLDTLATVAQRAIARSRQIWERDRLGQQQRWLLELMRLQREFVDLGDRLGAMAAALGRWFGGARVVFYPAVGDAIAGTPLECLDRHAFRELRDQLIPAVPPTPLGHLQLVRVPDLDPSLGPSLDPSPPQSGQSPHPSPATAPDDSPDHRQCALRQCRLASEAALPLHLTGRSPYLWGFVAIQHPQVYGWDPCDRAFVEHLAEPLAIAIESATIPTLDPFPNVAAAPHPPGPPTQLHPPDSATHLRRIVTHSPVILYAIDPQGTFTLSEGINLHRLGLKSGEAVGQNVFDLYRDHPDVCQYVREALTGQRTHWQTDIGNVIYDNRAVLLRDGNGHPVSLIGVATDVTEYTLARQALQALNADLENHIRQRTQDVESSNSRLRQSIATSRHIEQTLQRKTAEFKAILNALPDAVLVVSPTGQIVLANPAFERLLGHRWTDILGQPLAALDRLGDTQLTTLLCGGGDGAMGGGSAPMGGGSAPMGGGSAPMGGGFAPMGGGSAPIAAAPSQNGPEPKRLTLRDCHGIPIPVETRCATVCDRHGNPIGTVGILRDIRERQRTEAALQRSQARFRRLAANIPGVLHQFQRKGDGTYVINYVSKHFQNLCGCPPAEVYANPLRWVEVLHPRDRRSFSIALIQSAKQLSPLSWEGRLQLPQGKVRWIQWMAKPEGQPDGTIVWDGLLIDISDRKATEAELAQQRDLRVAFFEESTDALFLVDPLTHLTLDCNQQAIAIFEAKRPADLKGFAVNDLQVSPFTPTELEDLHRSLETYGIWSREVEYRTLRGRHFWGNLAIRTIAVAGHTLNLVRLTDISDRKTVESQLRAANHQLELANQELARATRLKDEFLANMSHELRTPLNAVIGLAEGLSAEVYGPLNPRQRKTLTTIHRSGGLLLSLINDILDLSKIEAGKLDLEMTQINVKRLVDASLTFVRQMAMEKHVQLECHLHQPGSRFYGDERRLCQLLVNLLSNAVKFTPAGGHIVLETAYEPLARTAAIAIAAPEQVNGRANDPGGHGRGMGDGVGLGQDQDRSPSADWLRFSVSDTGIGIAPDHLDKLFEPFTQIDSSLSRAHNGTGLGLALVQRIAQLHGGVVTVTSALGRGSCFTVWLPPTGGPAGEVAAAAAIAAERGTSPTLWGQRRGWGAGEAGPGAAACLRGEPWAGEEVPRDRAPAVDRTEGARRPPRILIAEDNETNIQVLRDYLQAQGYEVLLARNGLEAVRQARSLGPDLILMDVQMPLVDGLAATQRLRGDARFADLPILALTAHAMAGDRERCLAAGMTDYLSKPIQFPQLLATIEDYLRRSAMLDHRDRAE